MRPDPPRRWPSGPSHFSLSSGRPVLNLLAHVARWFRSREFSLENYRDRIVVALSLVAAAMRLPFTVIHFIQQRWLLGSILTIAQIVLTLDGLSNRRGHALPEPYWMLAALLGTTVCLSLWLQGLNGAMWAYPTMFISFFILPRRVAMALSVSLMGVVCLLAAWTLEVSIALRLAATLTLTLVMINVVLDLVDALQRSLSREAITDPLTGAFNRRHFDAELGRLPTDGGDGATATLLAIDIDHFKRINDTHGHAVGDEVLQRVVAEITTRKRKDDALFRVGGEEFMLLLSGARAEDARKIAEGLRQQIDTACILNDERLTVSIRGAEQKPRETLAEWSRRADAALYRAKRERRNRVVFIE